MKYLAIAALALAFAGGTTAQETSPLIRYELDNGLDVILHRDDRVPKIAVNISYRVGAMNEPPGRSGFAHLFEHLMFAGTPTVPNIDEAYAHAGLSINAYTWPDRTTYHAEGLKTALPLVLSVEADRMANQGSAITQEDLDIQRGVVLNEMRQNVLDWVTGSALEAMLTGLQPPSHPYSRSVLGSMADLEAATIEDVHAFSNFYYVPGNATLAVVGDFDVEEAKAMIADTFGRVAPGPDVPPVSATAHEPTRIRMTLEDKVAGPTLMLGWSFPAMQDDEFSRLKIVMELFNNPEYGVMRRSVIDAGLAASTLFWIDAGLLKSRYVLQLNGVEGADLAALEAEALGAISNFLARDLAPEALDRERRRVLIDERIENETFRALSESLLVEAEIRDDPGHALIDDPAVAAATPESVMAAARRYLDPADASVIYIEPGNGGDYPDVLTQSTGTPEPLVAAARPDTDIPQMVADELQPAAGPAVETATLSNGIRLVHYPLPAAPLTALAAVSSAGSQSAPPGKEGVVELAALMAPHGAGDTTPTAFAEAVRNLGAEILGRSDDLASSITLTAPPETFAAAVPLLADAVRRPLFDAGEWAVQVAATLDELGLREGDNDDLAFRYMEAALFPRAPGEVAIDRSIKSVKNVTLDDARSIFTRVFTPANVTFYSVGPTPVAEIVAALESRFGDWTSNAEPLVSAPREPATFPETAKILFVPQPAASQGAIIIATPGPGYNDPLRAETEVAFNLLAYEFISRLNSVIREEKGYSYGTTGRMLGTPHTGSVVAVEIPVETGAVGAALEEAFKGYASLVSEPPSEGELDRSVVDNYAYIADMTETGTGLADTLWEQLAVGSSVENYYALRTAITQTRLDDVRAAAANLADLGRAVIVVVGDPDSILPQLETLGLPVEILERNL
jgi:zinc protease